MTGSGHREIDHTADLGFELWAPTLEGLYAESVLAMGDLCYDVAAVDPREQRRLRVDGSDAEERLIRWLQEIYFMLETEMWLASEASEVALVDDGGTVVMFISYEGSFTATDGPASGLTSTDIGVNEPTDSPVAARTSKRFSG